MRRVASFLYGSMIGGLIGATIALLLAPSSGQELRDLMQDRAQNIQIEVKNAAESRRAELQQQLDVMRSPRKPTESE